MIRQSRWFDAPSTADRLRGYLALPHPWAVLVVMLATALFGLLATDGEPPPARYALMLVGMLGGQLAIGALNEYRDRELDAVAEPGKPIPAGLVSPEAALWVTCGGLVMMLAAGSSLGFLSLALLTLGTGAGLVYDLWLKGSRWSWLPYLIALPLLPIWVWATLDHWEPRLLLLYPFGAPMVLAVHLAQSLPDAESDRAAGVSSLVARLGRVRTFHLLFLATLIAIGEVVVFGLILSERPEPALLAGSLVLIVTLAVAAARRRVRSLDEHLFKVSTACTLALGLGWVISSGV